MTEQNAPQKNDFDAGELLKLVPLENIATDIQNRPTANDASVSTTVPNLMNDTSTLTQPTQQKVGGMIDAARDITEGSPINFNIGDLSNAGATVGFNTAIGDGRIGVKAGATFNNGFNAQAAYTNGNFAAIATTGAGGNNLSVGYQSVPSSKATFDATKIGERLTLAIEEFQQQQQLPPFDPSKLFDSTGR